MYFKIMKKRLKHQIPQEFIISENTLIYIQWLDKLQLDIEGNSKMPMFQFR